MDKLVDRFSTLYNSVNINIITSFIEGITLMHRKVSTKQRRRMSRLKERTRGRMGQKIYMRNGGGEEMVKREPVK
jgi:hypothetical protein